MRSDMLAMVRPLYVESINNVSWRNAVQILNVELLRADAERGLLDASGTPHEVQLRARLARRAVGQAVS
jgi:hypothetical protein